MNYLLENPGIVWELTIQHLQLTFITLFVGLAIALPVSLLIYYRPKLATPVMSVLGVLYTIPSLALMIMLLPLFGLNARSVVVALIAYAQIILVRNTLAGLQSIGPVVEEAALGMGLDGWRRWWWIQLPLALPVILAGVRIAAVVTVGIAAIGAKFGAGGLGVLLFDGIAQNRADKIWAGAIALSLLAFAFNFLLLALARVIDPQTRIHRAEKRSMQQAQTATQ